MFKSLLPYFKRKISAADLVIMALLVALSYILGLFDIYLTPAYKLFTLDFLPNAIGAALFGPFWGGFMGIATDTLSYFAKPAGGFCPGWMQSAVITNIIYGLFFYNRPVKILNAVLAQLLVTCFITMGLDRLWLALMYGTPAGELYSWGRIINNLIQFPFKVVMIIFFVRLSGFAYSKIIKK